MAGLVKELQAKIERLQAELEQTRAREAVLKLDIAAAERLLASEPRRGRRPKNRTPNLFTPSATSPNDHSITTTTSNGKNKTAVALDVIARANDRGVTADEIYAAFQQHGLRAKKNYVFNITSRLRQQGKLDQRGDKYYLKTG